MGLDIRAMDSEKWTVILSIIKIKRLHIIFMHLKNFDSTEKILTQNREEYSANNCK